MSQSTLMSQKKPQLLLPMLEGIGTGTQTIGGGGMKAGMTRNGQGLQISQLLQSNKKEHGLLMTSTMTPEE